MTVPAGKRPMTAEEYLAFTDTTEGRFELVDGELVELMSGTDRHEMLIGELSRLLSNALFDGPCRVYGHDRRLKVGHRFREPDLLVTCRPPGDKQYEDDAEYLVEVLSPGTGKIDLGDKVSEYKQLPSVRQYLVLDPDTRQAYLYERHELGWYVTEPEGVVRFAGVDLDLDAAHAVVDRKLQG